jgi:hypothetical protein
MAKKKQAEWHSQEYFKEILTDAPFIEDGLGQAIKDIYDNEPSALIREQKVGAVLSVFRELELEAE